MAQLINEVASNGDFEARPRLSRVIVSREESCAIAGYEEILRSALENAVRNAVRFTQEHSAVEIFLRGAQDPRRSQAIVSIRNHGPGVPEHQVLKIFQPFWAQPTPNGRTIDGSGLGMAITATAVHIHGGSVHAENALDGGLIVEIVLPL